MKRGIEDIIRDQLAWQFSPLSLCSFPIEIFVRGLCGLFGFFAITFLHPMGRVANGTENEVAAAKKTIEILGLAEGVIGFYSVKALAVLAVFVCAFLYKKANKLRDIRRQSNPFFGSSGLVLYLRAFSADRETIQPKTFFSMVGAECITDEERIVKALLPLGKPVAVGNPKQKLPGYCRRLYFTNEQWQDAVSILVEAASMVVIRLDGTDGVMWELEKLKRDAAPERVILFKPMRSESYSAIESARNKLPCNLRQLVPSATEPSELFSFDEYWVPRPIEDLENWAKQRGCETNFKKTMLLSELCPKKTLVNILGSLCAILSVFLVIVVVAAFEYGWMPASTSHSLLSDDSLGFFMLLGFGLVLQYFFAWIGRAYARDYR